MALSILYELWDEAVGRTSWELEESSLIIENEAGIEIQPCPPQPPYSDPRTTQSLVGAIANPLASTSPSKEEHF